MSEIPEGLRYTAEHEWFRVEGDLVAIASPTTPKTP